MPIEARHRIGLRQRHTGDVDIGLRSLTWLTRRAPFGAASLIDTDMTVDFAKETTPKDVVTVIATQPLTHHEPWETMAKGSLLVFRDGLPAAA